MGNIRVAAFCTSILLAISACGVAAFFANRRLKRHEVLGLRMIEKEAQ